MLPHLLEVRSDPAAGSPRRTIRLLSIDGGGIRGSSRHGCSRSRADLDAFCEQLMDLR